MSRTALTLPAAAWIVTVTRTGRGSQSQGRLRRQATGYAVAVKTTAEPVSEPGVSAHVRFPVSVTDTDNHTWTETPGSDTGSSVVFTTTA